MRSKLSYQIDLEQNERTRYFNQIAGVFGFQYFAFTYDLQYDVPNYSLKQLNLFRVSQFHQK